MNKSRRIRRRIMEEDNVGFHNPNMIRTYYISTVRMIMIF